MKKQFSVIVYGKEKLSEIKTQAQLHYSVEISNTVDFSANSYFTLRFNKTETLEIAFCSGTKRFTATWKYKNETKNVFICESGIFLEFAASGLNIAEPEAYFAKWFLSILPLTDIEYEMIEQ